MLQRRRNRKRQRSSRLKVAEEEVGEVPGGTFDARPRAVVARRLRALPPPPLRTQWNVCIVAPRADVTSRRE